MHSSLNYTCQKAGQALLILVGITLFAFILGVLAPGDPAVNRLTADPDYIPTPEEIEYLRAEFGLGQPIPVQYFKWLSKVVKGDLGQSYLNDKPVLNEILIRLPNTLKISFFSLFLIILLSIPGGLFMSYWHNRPPDLVSSFISIIIVSIPGFALAYMLIWIFSQQLHLLPSSGAQGMQNFILPVLTVSLSSAFFSMRLLRSSLLGELGKGYVLTARSKGLSRLNILVKHTLRNAMIPNVTSAANTFGALLGGSIICETIFAVPGVGAYALKAIGGRDYIAIQGYVLFTGFAFVVVNLIADLICAWLNPQMRLGGRNL